MYYVKRFLAAVTMDKRIVNPRLIVKGDFYTRFVRVLISIVIADIIQNRGRKSCEGSSPNHVIDFLKVFL